MTGSPRERLWSLLGLSPAEKPEDKRLGQPWGSSAAPCAEGACVITSENERVATAHHEAGHAVARALLGFRFDHVTIVETEDSYGHLTLDANHAEPDDPSDLASDDVFVHGAAWLAGMAAEARYAAGLGGPGFSACARCMWEQNLEGDAGKPKALEAGSDFYNESWIAAGAIVEQNQERIAAVANALLEQGILMESEVLNICAFR